MKIAADAGKSRHPKGCKCGCQARSPVMSLESKIVSAVSVAALVISAIAAALYIDAKLTAALGGNREDGAKAEKRTEK